jgi:biotin-(acetyl-CoA carboxylase) ligase
MLAKDLCVLFDENFQAVRKNEAQEILKNYNLHLYKLNETASFKKGPTIFSGIVKEVNEAGNIVIDSALSMNINQAVGMAALEA